MPEYTTSRGTFLVDPEVLAVLETLSPSGWNKKLRGPVFSPLAADAKRHAFLQRDRKRTLAALVLRIMTGDWPAEGEIVMQTGDPEDFRMRALKITTREAFAREKFGSAFDPDAGLTELPSGRVRARLFVPGRGLISLNTFDTREEARAARIEAHAKLQQDPGAFAAPPKPLTEVEQLRALLAERDARIAQLEAQLAQ